MTGRGRPRIDLDASQRRQLVRARQRVEDADANLRAVVASLLDDGASVRAIAEELQIAKATVWKIARSVA
jgi:DNA-binding NarL/FixJ family response regulator